MNGRLRFPVRTRSLADPGRALLAVALLLGLAVSPDATAQVANQRLARAPAALADVERAGLVMKGYRDTEGLKRVLADYFESASLFAPRVDPNRSIARAPDDRIAAFADVVREAGMDLEAMREMEQLVRGMDVSIYRVEFVPGFTGLDQPGAPPLDGWGDDDSGLGDDGGLTPGLPTRGSLVGNGVVSRSSVNYGNMWTTTETYSDGSQRTWTQGIVGNGNYIDHERTTTRDGTTTYEHLEVTDSTGRVTHSATTERAPEGGKTTMAEKARERAAQEAADVDAEDADAEDAGEAGAGEADAGDEDVDQYQPADGGGGTFCPLILEHCRRALAEMVETKDQILVGTVRVNPGDPDDQPEGSRFVYDPENLVINPSPESVGGRPRQLGARRFYMEIPVWVNPPGPNEP